MIARRPIASLLVVALGVLSVAGCVRSGKAPATDSAPPPANDGTTPPMAAPAAAKDDTWPELFLAPTDTGDERPRLVVGDLAMTRAEFRAGLEEFRRNEPTSPDPEAEYETIARRQLMLLAWVKRQKAAMGPAFDDSVRAELRAALAERVLAQATESRVIVSDAEVRARYERDIAKYRQPARVSIEIILVSAAEQAAQLQKQLEGGADFAVLARAQSLHSSSGTGGVLPPFSRGTYSPGLEDLAFQLKPGEIGTVSSERGVFVVRKIADSPEGATPLESVREAIAATIRDERIAAEQARFLAELERSMSVDTTP